MVGGVNPVRQAVNRAVEIIEKIAVMEPPCAVHGAGLRVGFAVWKAGGVASQAPAEAISAKPIRRLLAAM
jgi:hypothetical protein